MSGAPAGNQNAVGNEGGRPSKYKPEFAEQARKLCEQLGATVAQLAEFFDVHRSTIFEWQNEHDDFRAAIKLGKETPDENVKRSLYQRAVGYDIRTQKVFFDKDALGEDEKRVVRVETMEHIPADVSAARYWLQNRVPEDWRDRRELTGKDGAPLGPPPVFQIVGYKDEDDNGNGGAAPASPKP